MYLTDAFGVRRQVLRDYGAVNINFLGDTHLFIDPILIFNSNKPEYQQLHHEIIKYFHFLSRKAVGNVEHGELKAWFYFSEIPNNWLGFSNLSNKGLALGRQFAIFLCRNIGFMLQTNGISREAHFEKIMLLYPGNGRDKISDLTVNLILGFLCEYTQRFALSHIADDKCCKFFVERASFNYDTECFESREYILPFIKNESGKPEFVLLTPLDILRQGEPSINTSDMLQKNARIRDSIDNEVLRAQINNYINRAVREYEINQKDKRRPVFSKTIDKIERQCFQELLQEHPILYDYYIKLREEDANEINNEATREREQLLESYSALLDAFNQSITRLTYQQPQSHSAREEAISRVQYFKQVIENNDGYTCLYHDDRPIANEDFIQRLFRFAWYETKHKLDAETNNGRGEVDFLVSYGRKDVNLIEFKLASNSKLPHVFDQVKVYENANETEDSVIVIFFFTVEEENRAKKMIAEAGRTDQINRDIFLVDCRRDNKQSASRV